MTGLLLAVIYLAFISLGLPDALLGSAWPSMYPALGATVSGAGNIAMIISLGTILSSLLSDRVIRRFGTGWVTAISVAVTAGALFGFSCCGSYWQLCLWAIPYGLGAGAIDSALNNYVALHYKARHMSFLHCMWGVGATLGPYIMGLCLTRGLGWQAGYRIVGGIQAALTAVVALSLPMWKGGGAQTAETTRNVLSIPQALRLPGAPQVLLCFFGYCALEQSVGLWAASWLHETRGVPAETAASYGAMFYLGITAGRAVSGLISERMGDRRMIRLGLGTIALGAALLLAAGNGPLALGGLVVIGLGCAPVYPSVIHSTPQRFGPENSQSLVGMQMAAAYVGSCFMPKLFGALSDWAGMGLLPIWIAGLWAMMLGMSEWANRVAHI